MNNEDRFVQALKGVQYIVINTRHGGFSLSDLALERYKKYTGQDLSQHDIARDDPVLVKIVKELGPEADGAYSTLKVVEVPGDVDWEIDEYDGDEWVAEKHRRWS